MEGNEMVTIETIVNEVNHIADIHEEDFHHALDAKGDHHDRKDLQEKNSFFLKKLKEKYFPVKSEEQDQFLFPFLKSIPAACSTVRRERGEKKRVKKILRYEELQLI
jgi:hypothetical protein